MDMCLLVPSPSGTPWTQSLLVPLEVALHGHGFAGPTLSLVPRSGTPWNPVCWSLWRWHSMDMGLLVPPSLWFLWHTMDPGFAGPSGGFAGPTLSLVPLAHHRPRVCWSLWRWHSMDMGLLVPLEVALHCNKVKLFVQLV